MDDSGHVMVDIRLAYALTNTISLLFSKFKATGMMDMVCQFTKLSN
jgi:hypothetical protein